MESIEIQRTVRESTMLFGKVKLPNNLLLHVYLTVMIAAMFIIAQIYMQWDFTLPAEKQRPLQVNDWPSIILLLFALTLHRKCLFRRVMDKMRLIAREKNLEMTDEELEFAADQANGTFWGRIYHVFHGLILLAVFVMMLQGGIVLMINLLSK